MAKSPKAPKKEREKEVTLSFPRHSFPFPRLPLLLASGNFNHVRLTGEADYAEGQIMPNGKKSKGTKKRKRAGGNPLLTLC